MYYVISFDGCGLESPLRSKWAESALALAEEAERHGCANVQVAVPDGQILSILQFRAAYCGGSPSG